MELKNEFYLYIYYGENINDQLSKTLLSFKAASYSFVSGKKGISINFELQYNAFYIDSCLTMSQADLGTCVF